MAREEFSLSSLVSKCSPFLQPPTVPHLIKTLPEYFIVTPEHIHYRNGFKKLYITVLIKAWRIHKQADPRFNPLRIDCEGEELKKVNVSQTV